MTDAPRLTVAEAEDLLARALAACLVAELRRNPSDSLRTSAGRRPTAPAFINCRADGRVGPGAGERASDANLSTI